MSRWTRSGAEGGVPSHPKGGPANVNARKLTTASQNPGQRATATAATQLETGGADYAPGANVTPRREKNSVAAVTKNAVRVQRL